MAPGGDLCRELLPMEKNQRLREVGVRPYRKRGIEDELAQLDTQSQVRLFMPERETVERAREDAREGKSPSTQAGEFVREEIHHVRENKHGARSPQQAIAIGLSKARRAGVKLGPPKGSAALRKKAARDSSAGKESRRKTSRTRSRAVSGALKREPKSTASHGAVSRQTRKSAAKRGPRARSAAARKAARTREAA
jgi:hypothetical protein